MRNQVFKDVWGYFSNAQKIAYLVLFALCVLIGVLIPLLLPNSSMRQIELSRNYQAGELSDEDVYSPQTVNFIDEVATENARAEARRAVLPYYSFNLLNTIADMNLVHDYAESLSTDSATSPYAVLREAGILDTDLTNRILNLPESDRNIIAGLIEDVMKAVLAKGVYSAADINESLSQGYSMITTERLDSRYSVYTETVDVSSLLMSEYIYEYLINYGFNNYREIGDSNIIIIAELIRLLASPNVSYDALETDNRRNEAAVATAPVSVRLEAGDLIIARDSIITEQALRIIDEINSMRVYVPIASLIADAVFLFVILSFATCFTISCIQYRYRIPLYSIMFVSGLIIILILSFFFMRWILSTSDRVTVDPLLPFLFLPVLFTCMTNKRRIGFAIGFVTAGFAVLFPTSSKYTFFHLLVVIEASVLFARHGTNRIDVIYEALYSALIAAVATAAFSLINGYSYEVLASNIVFIILNVLFTYIAVSVSLPILEKIFNLPTQFRLHELSYTDSPTLNRLSQVAQGTFNHVRNVSDMSYAAAKEIGVDAELTRVGALYHDIGKAEHPEYFIENQGGKGNAHDELNNNLSAAIIKSHVKLGVEKGREIGLPQEVLDIISQHHGNDIITYFYNEAKKNSPDGRFVHEEDFRYNSDIPQSPEAAIVMLADCVEAASRTLKNPNTQKYDRLIMNIIISKINHNQLADSKLTLTDLVKIKDTFIRSLVGRDHQRIEYDKE